MIDLYSNGDKYQAQDDHEVETGANAGQVLTEAEDKPRRVWIEGNEDEPIFYKEKELDEKGTRIIDYTDAYKMLENTSYEESLYDPEVDNLLT